MSLYQPFQVTGFHSCDKEIGLRVLNGDAELNPSNNKWDWLGEGTYFWEQNPLRALEYAIESASGLQYNKIPIKIPFVLGTTIELGNCLNLVEPGSLAILTEAYTGLEKIYQQLGKKLPVNKGNMRILDCVVLKYVHQSRKENEDEPYDTIRCAFPEGNEVYPGASFSTRGHIQICVLNDKLIRGYFLPRPIEIYNPYLRNEFIPK